MLVEVVCTKCDATLKAPESVLGKRVKCTKCKEAFVAQLADEEAEEPPVKTVKMKAAVAPAPKRKSKADDDEEAEETPRTKKKKGVERTEEDDEPDQVEEAEEAPKPKSKKKGKKGKKKPVKSPMMLYVLIGVGALVLIGGGLGVYFGFIREGSKDGTAAQNAANDKATAGWVQITESGGKYRIKFPQKPETTTKKNSDAGGAVAGNLYSYSSAANDEEFNSTHLALPPGVTKDISDEEKLERMFGNFTLKSGSKPTKKKSMKYQGLPCIEFAFVEPGISGVTCMRVIWAGTRIIMLTGGGAKHADGSPTILAFFDSLRID